MRSPHLRRLGELASGDLRPGGKARALAALTRRGLPVLPGFALASTAFTEFLARSSVHDALEDLFRHREFLQDDFLERVLSDLAAALRLAPLEPHLAAALREAARQIVPAGGTLVVRSSAASEDSRAGSSAGQYRSVLDVPHVTIVESVLDCWTSVLETAPVRYNLSRGQSPVPAMGVLIQPCRQFDRSGVLFTEDPADPSGERMRLEHVEGNPAALMSGVTTPCTLLMTREGPVVVPDWAQALRRLGREVEDILGGPQDIEWGLEGDRLWLLQARPIVRVRHEPSRPKLLASFNLRENLPRPITPMGWSTFSEVYVRHAIGAHPLRHGVEPGWSENALFSLRRSRLYWNLGGVNRLAGRARGTLLEALALVAEPSQVRAITRAVREGLLDDRQIFPFSVIFVTLLRATAAFVGRWRPGRWPAAQLEDMGREIEARWEDFVERHPPGDLEGISRLPAEMFAMAAPFVERLFGWAIVDQILVTLTRSYLRLTAGYRGDLRLEADREPSSTFLMNRKLAALARLAAAEPEWGPVLERREPGEILARIRRSSSTFARRFRVFLEEHGHRGACEFDLASPRWSEDPRPVIEYIVNIMHSHSPGETRRFEPPPPRGWLRRLPGFEKIHRVLLEKLLGWIAKIGPVREDPKHHVLRTFQRVRQYLLEIGEILHRNGTLDRREDVMMVRMHELDWLARHPRSRVARAVISARRVRLAEAAATPPPALVWEPAPPSGWDDEPAVRGDRLCGVGASRGVVRGRARRVLEAGTGAGARLEPGEVLVAPWTDPTWTPLFLGASAIVVETGGILSHGPVVARELGIPCVVGVEGALDSIEDGDLLEVDGETGRVEVVGKREEGNGGRRS